MVAEILYIAIVLIEIFILLQSDSNCVVNFGENISGEGVEGTTPNGFTLCSYKGIPYAESKRFEPPKAVPLWKGKKIFTQEANICVQTLQTLEVVGNENCLFLNVYTISNRAKVNHTDYPLMPVMFWIHGGSFNVGSASSDINGPDYIVEKEVVFVSINYRLGPLGFLSWPNANITGNNGLRDQVMALQWVYDNIIHFGGNSEKITLCGWSAGGASVSFHLYMSQSLHLFDKAIMMSGNMLNPWAFQYDVARCTYELLKLLHISNTTGGVDKLRSMNVYDLMEPLISDELTIKFFGIKQFCFTPTLDDEFIRYSPHLMINRKPAADIPIMIGHTSLEFQYNVWHKHHSIGTNNIQFLNRNLTIPKIINDFLTEFFQNSCTAEKERFEQSFHRTADISYGIYKFIEIYTNLTKEKRAYLYRFAFDGKFGNFREDDATIGAEHGDDLEYFLQHNNENYNKNNLKSEIKTRDRMVTMWINFIKFGNPTPSNDDFLNLTWPHFNNEDRFFLNIDEEVTIEKLKNDDGPFQLWDAIYQCLYNIQCNKVHQYLYNNKSILY